MKNIYFLILPVVVFIAYITAWNLPFWKHIRQRQERQYRDLYQKIQNLLIQSSISAHDFEQVRQMLCELHNLKYKNKEMSDVLARMYMVRKYSMTREEMAETKIMA